mmetsp:Transcript_3228/g.4416  ORF Transcript_3228/g.4416 Transcript_3228/m.4416 type:complete len:207 (+) Transcript_3228:1053-1673(+)
MQVTLSNLRQDLSLANNQTIQTTRHTHQMPHSIITTQHKQILPQHRHGKSTTIRQIISQARHSRTSISSGVVNFKSIARRKNSCFCHSSIGTNLIRRSIPFRLSNGKLFSHFYRGMMDGKTNHMHLKSLRCSFETFRLCSFARSRRSCCRRILTLCYHLMTARCSTYTAAAAAAKRCRAGKSHDVSHQGCSSHCIYGSSAEFHVTG